MSSAALLRMSSRSSRTSTTSTDSRPTTATRRMPRCSGSRPGQGVARHRRLRNHGRLVTAANRTAPHPCDAARPLPRRAHRRGHHGIPHAADARGGGGRAGSRVRVPHLRPHRARQARRRRRRPPRRGEAPGFRRDEHHASLQAARPRHRRRARPGCRAPGRRESRGVRRRIVSSGTTPIGWATATGSSPGLPEASFERVVQIGCGGAGAATAYALLSRGAARLDLFDVDDGARGGPR